MSALLEKYLKSPIPFFNNTRLRTTDGYINRVAKNPKGTPIANSLNKTNFDLVDSRPSGGPLNDVQSGFVHKYLPRKTYLSTLTSYR
jgi:hypothetical protein